jgi:general secretion pathway protein N
MATRLFSHHAVGIFLGALCLGLGALAASEFRATPVPTQGQEPPSAPSKTPATTTTAAFSLPPVQRFAIVTERPLFSPNRKPPQHTDDAAGAWPSFVLAGIIITPASREALVLHGKPQSIAHIQEGQALEGWTVTSIDPDRVVFRDGLSEHELKLIPKAPPPTVATRPRLPAE